MNHVDLMILGFRQQGLMYEFREHRISTPPVKNAIQPLPLYSDGELMPSQFFGLDDYKRCFRDNKITKNG